MIIDKICDTTEKFENFLSIEVYIKICYLIRFNIEMKAIIIVLLLIAVPTLQDLVVECRDVQPNCTGAGFSITGS